MAASPSGSGAEPKTVQRDCEPGVAVWCADGSATVELARLAGPCGGCVEAPAHLLGLSGGQRVDLDEASAKVSLYEACLTHGGPFDLYRWVNLSELARLWRRLRLPVDVAAAWTRALRDAGVDVGPMPARRRQFSPPASRRARQSS